LNKIENLRVELFADGADLNAMLQMHSKKFIKGLTTNPTLMRKAGITDYKAFAVQVLEKITDKPISFEVFSDDLNEMVIQARKIAQWGQNVFVKIPITNTKNESTEGVVKTLTQEGIKVNVTAVMTIDQVNRMMNVLNPEIPSNISIFAGRIADTGQDPIPLIANALNITSKNMNCKIIWASPRELLNVFQADDIGCHIITVTNDILGKLDLVDKNLNEYSLETVEMFFNDAASAGYFI
jgi:transaldolase